MKSAALLLLLALPAMAAESWSDAYNRGVDLVRAGKFQAGAQALQHAVEEVPEENSAARVRDQIFTYTPHFWLGIARLNLGDPDGALREWKISEDQGAVKNTPYYAQLRELTGKANSQKQQRAERAVDPNKQEANAAIGRAISAQAEALTAKFANCAARALPQAQVARLARLLLQLDEAASLRALVAAIALPAKGSSA